MALMALPIVVTILKGGIPLEYYYTSQYYPNNWRYLIFVSDQGLIKFEGKPIPDVCQICQDGHDNPEREMVLPNTGVQAIEINKKWLDSCKDWSRLRLLSGLANIKDLKWIVKSLFPRYAIKFDLGIDATDYELVRMTFYDWQVKTIHKMVKKGRTSDGRVVRIELNSMPSTANNWTNAEAVSPLGSMLVSAKLLPGNGIKGIWELEVLVPPAANA